VLGGYGTVAYAAANSFLDAYAHAQRRRYGGRWVSIAWEAWQNTQIATVSADLAEIALSATEGHRLFEQILARRGVTQVAISRLELNARIAEWQVKGHRSKTTTPTTQTTRHPRPALPTLFIAPATEAEQKIATIWEAALGIEQVGVLDNFFELGGDSLLAIQTATHLRRAFEMEIPVVALYEGLTIRALAQVLERLRAEAAPTSADEPENGLSDREARMAQRRELQQRQRERRR
jgi:acyl carrier protein